MGVVGADSCRQADLVSGHCCSQMGLACSLQHRRLGAAVGAQADRGRRTQDVGRSRSFGAADLGRGVLHSQGSLGRGLQGGQVAVAAHSCAAVEARAATCAHSGRQSLQGPVAAVHRSPEEGAAGCCGHLEGSTQASPGSSSHDGGHTGMAQHHGSVLRTLCTGGAAHRAGGALRSSGLERGGRDAVHRRQAHEGGRPARQGRRGSWVAAGGHGMPPVPLVRPGCCGGHHQAGAVAVAAHRARCTGCAQCSGVRSQQHRQRAGCSAGHHLAACQGSMAAVGQGRTQAASQGPERPGGSCVEQARSWPAAVSSYTGRAVVGSAQRLGSSSGSSSARGRGLGVVRTLCCGCQGGGCCW
mmetsp:Transcript_23414/g.59935  ORF Transcript_23414/g.59935 Transcript_23414/m.59935 type:complete len:356 (+) Transcript_23414:1317-2384(+)